MNKACLRELWDTIKHNNIQTPGVLEEKGEERKGQKKVGRNNGCKFAKYDGNIQEQSVYY